MQSEPDVRAALERTPAQFFFEVGFGAAYAEALIRADMKPPFEYSDALVERAWSIAREAHDVRRVPDELDGRLISK
ncbi:MAG: hypothetical protein EON59_03890 [Alphaproteobacteria bacterium]|nr:MAG: hypothetical protein EON59_03890 [Alphaproteobacteria bacterium]